MGDSCSSTKPETDEASQKKLPVYSTPQASDSAGIVVSPGCLADLSIVSPSKRFLRESVDAMKRPLYSAQIPFLTTRNVKENVTGSRSADGSEGCGGASLTYEIKTSSGISLMSRISITMRMAVSVDANPNGGPACHPKRSSQESRQCKQQQTTSLRHYLEQEQGSFNDKAQNNICIHAACLCLLLSTLLPLRRAVTVPSIFCHVCMR